MELVTPEIREKLLANGANRAPTTCPWSSCSTPAAPGRGSSPNSTPKTPPSRSDSPISASVARRQAASASKELEAFKGPFGLGIERDLYFEGKFSLAVYAEAARAAGRIVEHGPELDAAARRRSAATCG